VKLTFGRERLFVDTAFVEVLTRDDPLPMDDPTIFQLPSRCGRP